MRDSPKRLAFGPRRAVFIDVGEQVASPLDDETLEHFESFDEVYRSLCALMFNYVPTSGHPGGSISSGRFVQALLFETMDYDLSSPDRFGADIVSYAAGHKALGLYALWALRNEVARIGASDLLPVEDRKQLRLEDLLGFRRNPITDTPRFRQYSAKALDGHPTPATPFVRIATGASGVGLAGSIGLAWAEADLFGDDSPRVHIVEGEGGMTPGRVSEALAAAGTASLGNVFLHVDWNQASIDSNHVCRDGEEAGEYVQWSPTELCYLHDWNVVYVADGLDFQQIIAAQRAAMAIGNGQPTALIYRTRKGWQYGIEGAASHGAGHPLCSEGFYNAVAPLTQGRPEGLPTCNHAASRCGLGADPAIVEDCYWHALKVVRRALEQRRPAVYDLAERLRAARDRLDHRAPQHREDAPDIEHVYDSLPKISREVPAALRLEPGKRTTLRDELGRTLGHLNKVSFGAFVTAAADLLGSTSVSKIAEGFPTGFYNRVTNPRSRTLATGGICEDAMAGILSGISSIGYHIGVGSSYAAFNAALGHVAARLHAIGNQARQASTGEPYRPFFLVCAHAGLKTGEDGPTHADPQALQLLQGNFPAGTMITLTPWDPQELWFLVTAALDRRPAVIAPFVTRPPETVLDREVLGLAPARAAAKGVYRLVGTGRSETAVVLQGSAVAYAFIDGALPLLREEGLELDVYYVASAELFDALPDDERGRVFPEEHARAAIGITDFTLPTMERWILSRRGRDASLHPFRNGHFLGSGAGAVVLREAGLDGRSQFEAIREFVDTGH